MNTQKTVEDLEKVVGVLKTVDVTKIKSGYKTTEFWVTVASAVCGVLVAIGKITPEQSSTAVSTIVPLVGLGMAALPTITYIISRGNLKK